MEMMLMAKKKEEKEMLIMKSQVSDESLSKIQQVINRNRQLLAHNETTGEVANGGGERIGEEGRKREEGKTEVPDALVRETFKDLQTAHKLSEQIFTEGEARRANQSRHAQIDDHVDKKVSPAPAPAPAPPAPSRLSFLACLKPFAAYRPVSLYAREYHPLLSSPLLSSPLLSSPLLSSPSSALASFLTSPPARYSACTANHCRGAATATRGGGSTERVRGCN
eukprot:599805-Hanusia_phi.AAC.2